MLDHNYLYFEPLIENDVVLILGATNGDFIKEHKHEILQKNVFVINVEPTLEGVFHLSDYIKRNMPENASVISCAVSSLRGTMLMDIRENLITSTLENRPETNQRWPMPLLYRQKTTVLSLDDILQTANVTKLFADIEGSEIDAVGGSSLIYNVPYIAIASYHIVDGEPTHIRLNKWLNRTHKVSVTGEASNFRKEEVVLFAQRN